METRVIRSNTPANQVETLWRWITQTGEPRANAAALTRLANKPFLHVQGDVHDYLFAVGLGGTRGGDLEDLLTHDVLGCRFVPTVRYYRPRPRDVHAQGFTGITFLDLAVLLIRLEAWGVPIDPAPAVAIAKARIPQGDHDMLTHGELTVHWWEKARHKMRDVYVAAASLPGREAQQARTRAGYHAAIGPNGLVVRGPAVGASAVQQAA